MKLHIWKKNRPKWWFSLYTCQLSETQVYKIKAVNAQNLTLKETDVKWVWIFALESLNCIRTIVIASYKYLKLHIGANLHISANLPKERRCLLFVPLNSLVTIVLIGTNCKDLKLHILAKLQEKHRCLLRTLKLPHHSGLSLLDAV